MNKIPVLNLYTKQEVNCNGCFFNESKCTHPSASYTDTINAITGDAFLVMNCPLSKESKIKQ